MKYVWLVAARRAWLSACCNAFHTIVQTHLSPRGWSTEQKLEHEPTRSEHKCIDFVL